MQADDRVLGGARPLQGEIGMETLIHERVAAARQGRNPAVVARVISGWVVMGDHQILPGYCLLLPDPVVASINDLEPDARRRFLSDMVALGDALLATTDAERVNYELLGNSEPALHARVTPRYAWEDPDLRARNAWRYDRGRAPRFDAARDAAFMEELRGELERTGVTA